MEIELKKWGNSIGFRIPHKIAESFGLEENSIVELTESKDALVITKKPCNPTLDRLLSSIPEDFRYPEDVLDFVESGLGGTEMI
ncbi:AbrB/MazE/SpoVT family DNA-binding domain-containing protein [Microcystis aeruginosa]|jgi:antitoxin MazE|uniref:AbrB/MazE/SpoVT family DNA-binding domain-containing protein n=1 Tax=Microcystis aeruginosa 11-30S32 TaxID=2358142 RepID=A0A510PKF6_MICAE|nr:AbrB/MazE/SpoVT family DNA-binding domain-containing protein [Microcystis aeruginosa]GCA94325.1 AbrB/MazE/SpoVT family DNA-binding domain-containing protein [Microcystis aeruginosa 11-30S32]